MDWAIGPATGDLIVRTGREGAAARVGHDLTIMFTRWSGTVVVADATATVPATVPATATVLATVEVASMAVIEGTGGVKGLTDGDKREIKATALRLLRADRHPEASFASTSIDVQGESGTMSTMSGSTMSGELTINGATVPVSFELRAGPAWHARTVVQQSRFGIKPYRAFLGALRLADDVSIDVDVALPSGP